MRTLRSNYKLDHFGTVLSRTLLLRRRCRLARLPNIKMLEQRFERTSSSNSRNHERRSVSPAVARCSSRTSPSRLTTTAVSRAQVALGKQPSSGSNHAGSLPGSKRETPHKKSNAKARRTSKVDRRADVSTAEAAQINEYIRKRLVSKGVNESLVRAAREAAAAAGGVYYSVFRHECSNPVLAKPSRDDNPC